MAISSLIAVFYPPTVLIPFDPPHSFTAVGVLLKLLTTMLHLPSFEALTSPLPTSLFSVDDYRDIEADDPELNMWVLDFELAATDREHEIHTLVEDEGDIEGWRLEDSRRTPMRM
ncbi:hypothetical protein SNOG_13638 [Parastagonospora nodorum SN15]|uniref:Uncharacterized protein n=1 Tax=Phaeosphaeria nodorum (strain SN15 / ATCC MYA-4574 / FGSC 10173) TaxID=321614 RepID=Q0U3M6_PHANO|nr:hypothetical protein SNOG_13638 [Parastagonospora nodorum SN15]EAT79085.1 hypothetical protein SNOG_13638 [Parastagonospora nodorum SN15]